MQLSEEHLSDLSDCPHLLDFFRGGRTAPRQKDRILASYFVEWLFLRQSITGAVYVEQIRLIRGTKATNCRQTKVKCDRAKEFSFWLYVLAKDFNLKFLVDCRSILLPLPLCINMDFRTNQDYPPRLWRDLEAIDCDPELLQMAHATACIVVESEYRQANYQSYLDKYQDAYLIVLFGSYVPLDNLIRLWAEDAIPMHPSKRRIFGEDSQQFMAIMSSVITILKPMQGKRLLQQLLSDPVPEDWIDELQSSIQSDSEELSIARQSELIGLIQTCVTSWTPIPEVDVDDSISV